MTEEEIVQYILLALQEMKQNRQALARFDQERQQHHLDYRQAVEWFERMRQQQIPPPSRWKAAYGSHVHPAGKPMAGWYVSHDGNPCGRYDTEAEALKAIEEHKERWR